MMLRLLSGSLRNRISRLATASLAMLLGALLVSALSTLSLDLGSKVSEELRNYGANILLTPRMLAQKVGSGGLSFGEVSTDRYIDEKELDAAFSDQMGGDIIGYVPYLYGVVQVATQDVILTGTRFGSVQEVSPWWKVEGEWPREGTASPEALVGTGVAQKSQLSSGDNVTLMRQDRSMNFRIVGIVETGASEDNQILVQLPVAQSFLRQENALSVVQVSASSDHLPTAQIASNIDSRVPSAVAKPVGQIADTERSVLGKIQLLMGLVSLFVLIAAALAVMSTMTTTVLERTKEIGLMKSLGAESRQVALLFFGEAGLIALVGGIAGYGGGYLFAQVIGHVVFNVAIDFNLLAVPLTLGVAVLVSFVASAIPVGRALSIDPAVTLRGE